MQVNLSRVWIHKNWLDMVQLMGDGLKKRKQVGVELKVNPKDESQIYLVRSFRKNLKGHVNIKQIPLK